MLTLSLCLLLVPLVWCELEGWLASPGHPLAYPNSIRMNWTLCAPVGLFLSLTLIHLELENSTQCEHDVLMIHVDHNLKKSLCSSMSYEELQSSVNPQLVSTSGGCLSIYFSSDESLPQMHTGFNASYILQGSNCGKPKPLVNGHVHFIKGSNNEYQSVIEYCCNKPYYIPNETQNVRYTRDTDNTWRETGNSVIPSCLPVCGKHKLSSYGRILGGKKAPLGSFPWQVLLYVGTSHGGGFIISEKWVMTAANNFGTNSITPPISTVKVYAGHNDINEKGKFTELKVSSIHIHPYYNNSDNTNFDNDIALIKLNTSVTFRETIRPLCLPSTDLEIRRRAGLVSGFGLTENFTKINKLLNYVMLPIVDQETCRTSFEREVEKDSFSLTDNMFCAGYEEGGKDSCTGDSGSAFVMKKDGVYCAVGIVSWGPIECGKEGTYGVYTRVTRYLDWINKTMSENQ